MGSWTGSWQLEWGLELGWELAVGRANLLMALYLQVFVSSKAPIGQRQYRRFVATFYRLRDQTSGQGLGRIRPEGNDQPTNGPSSLDT